MTKPIIQRENNVKADLGYACLSGETKSRTQHLIRKCFQIWAQTVVINSLKAYRLILYNATPTFHNAKVKAFRKCYWKRRKRRLPSFSPFSTYLFPIQRCIFELYSLCHSQQLSIWTSLNFSHLPKVTTLKSV